MRSSDTGPGGGLRADPGTDFLAAVAAGLPAGFWAQPALVGVSGGSDSVALLVALARLAPPAGAGRLCVVHADHGLRPTALRDREFTERLAASLGLRCVVGRLAVGDDVGPGGEGLEARARRLRHRLFAATAQELGARHVALAHTADDQAETILHRVLRGTGLRGLAGMAAARELTPGIALVRPLLAVPRSATRDFLVVVGQGWCEDETNADTARARNFLRHEILARCVTAHYPAAAAALVRIAEHAADAAGAVADAADHLLDLHATRAADGTVILRAQAFFGLSPQLVCEVFRAVWRREGWPERDMTSRHYRSLAALLAAVGAAGPTTTVAADMPGGIHVAAGTERTLTLRPAQEGMATRR